MVKKIPVLEGAIGTIFLLRDSLLGIEPPSRADVFRSEVDDFTIDTCLASDTEAWETAIWRHDKAMKIVEQYKNRKAAKRGHDDWVEKVKANPEVELPDLFLWE